MKNGFHTALLLFGLLCLLAGSGTVAAAGRPTVPGQTVGQDGDRRTGPEIVFRHMQHDFGTLDYKGEPAAYDFVFTNEGTAPLVILDAEVNCKCLRVEYPKKPVPAAGQGTVRVTYDPRKERGPFTKGISLYTNAGENRLVLVVRGNVR